MENFVEGEVIIYEGYLQDYLCVFDSYNPNSGFVYLNELNGEPYRHTTPDRIRKTSVEEVKSEINELECRTETLKKALELIQS